MQQEMIVVNGYELEPINEEVWLIKGLVDEQYDQTYMLRYWEGIAFPRVDKWGYAVGYKTHLDKIKPITHIYGNMQDAIEVYLEEG